MKFLLVLICLFSLCGCDDDCAESDYLDSHGISVSDSALLENAFKGNLEIVQKLLSCNININAKGRDGSTALIYAANVNSVEMLDALLKRGADATIANTMGATALHMAAQNGSVDAIVLLVNAGADKDAIGPYGRTPLYMASDSGKAEAAKALLHFGASSTIREMNEWTPAHIAASNGHLEILTLLLSEKNAVSVNDASIPLLIPAVTQNRVEVVDWLLAHGASPDAKSLNGSTAMQIAQQVSNPETLHVLCAQPDSK